MNRQRRRVTDQPLPLGPKDRLQRLIDLAEAKGAHTHRAELLAIAAYLEELEAKLDRLASLLRAGHEARMRTQNPERRSEIASHAAKRRWHPPDASSLFG
jgi:hypothetical protein